MSFVFETPRLIVRLLKKSDEAAFYKLMSNPKVVIYTPSKVLNKEESDLKLASLMNANHHFWAVEFKKYSEFIGIAGLKIHSNTEAEIAYNLREIYWSKGFGSEVAIGLIEYGFNHFNYSKLKAFTDSKNKNSIKILSKRMNYLGSFYSKEYKSEDESFELRKVEWKNRTNSF